MPSALQFHVPQNATFAFFLRSLLCDRFLRLLRCTTVKGGSLRQRYRNFQIIKLQKNAPKMRFKNALPPEGPFPKCKNNTKICDTNAKTLRKCNKYRTCRTMRNKCAINAENMKNACILFVFCIFWRPGFVLSYSFFAFSARISF